MQGATGDGAGQCSGAERNPAHQQIDPGPGSGTCGNSTTDAHTQLLEGFRVEQVIAPTAIEQRQIAGCGILWAEGVELEQGLDATLLTLAYGFAQFADRLLFLLGFTDHTASAGRAIDQ
ncbi:hypothetical protein D3C85_1378250 [compost metagenome]